MRKSYQVATAELAAELAYSNPKRKREIYRQAKAAYETYRESNPRGPGYFYILPPWVDLRQYVSYNVTLEVLRAKRNKRNPVEAVRYALRQLGY